MLMYPLAGTAQMASAPPFLGFSTIGNKCRSKDQLIFKGRQREERKKPTSVPPSLKSMCSSARPGRVASLLTCWFVLNLYRSQSAQAYEESTITAQSNLANLVPDFAPSGPSTGLPAGYDTPLAIPEQML